MNALVIGETLFIHTLRNRGFAAALLAAALGLLSLAEVTAFALGRELEMIREGALGTLFIAASLGALLAVVLATGRSSSPWMEETRARTSSPGSVPMGLFLLALLTSSWVFLSLVPFFVSSLCLFHHQTGAAFAALFAGLASLLLALFTIKRMPRAWLLALWALPAAAVSLLLLAILPKGQDLILPLAIGFPAALLAASIPGTFASILPGPAGWIASLAIFLLANMRQGLVESPILGPVFRLLPDLAALNPSMILAAGESGFAPALIGTLLYCSIFVLGTMLIICGRSSLAPE